MTSCNVGNIDRIARGAIGIVLLILAFGGAASGIAAWVLGALGLVALGTAGMRFCPLYRVLGLNTCKP